MGKPKSESTIKEIIQLYQDGNTQNEIAKQLGISQSTVSNHVIKSGNRKTKPTVTKSVLDALSVMRSVGISKEDICRELNIGSSTYQKYSKKMGLLNNGKTNIDAV